MELSRPAIEPIVYVNNSADETLHVVSIHRSLGGASVDRCVLVRDMGPLGVPSTIQDFELGFQQDATVHVVVMIDDLEFTAFWGKIKSVSVEIGERGEFLRYEARLDHYLIAESTTNTHIRGGKQEFSCNLPLVFNPLIDGIIEPNRSPIVAQTVAGNPFLIVDPESVRTTESLTYHFGDPDAAPHLWNLAEAVHYLCWMHNPEETYIANPTIGECEQFLDTDRELLQNVAIPFGVSLPIALDRLLQPYGYDHFVDHYPRIRLVKKGDRNLHGTQFPLSIQVLGETIDPELSMIPRTQLSFDISQLINVIIIHGDFIELEGTFELYRAWPEEDDELTEEDLDIERGEEYTEHTRTWRDWVLNEANDYTGTRPEIEDFPDVGSDVGSLEGFPTEIVNAFLPKRRKFYPAVTQDEDKTPLGNSRGVELEWFDVTVDSGSSEPDGAWRPVSWPFEVLENECGIRFGGKLPSEMMDAFHRDGLKLRITASIRGDNRVTVEKDARTTSVNTDRVEQALLLDDRFLYRQRVPDDLPYGSKYYGSGLKPYNAVDSREDMQKLADKLIETWNAALVGGPVVVEGIDRLKWQLGDVIERIEGRNINLAGTPGLAFPHVAAIEINVPDQTVVLTLASFRQEAPDG